MDVEISLEVEIKTYYAEHYATAGTARTTVTA